MSEGGGGVSKMLMHDYGGGEGGWPCDEISKEVFFQSEVVFKLSSAVLLKFIMFFISGFSLIYINVNNC